jgi:phosphatidylinositol glycan class S
MALGEDPEFFDDDYIVVGLAHCFVKDDNSKLQDVFVIEGIPAGAVECMDNGGVTCYKHTYGTTLGEILKQDVSLLPKEFQGGVFADDFDFRTKCCARTWKRSHAQEHLLNMVPVGTVRSDFNFKIEDKRILNQENEVKDEDNIKQDLSIDVYGRKKEDEENEIASLYTA